jgi:serpin B
MRILRRVVFFPLLIPTLLWGCGSTSSEVEEALGPLRVSPRKVVDKDSGPVVAKYVEPAKVQQLQQLSQRLAAVTLSNPQTVGNELVSPLSLIYSLELLRKGATAKGKQELDRLLGEEQVISSQLNLLTDSLERVNAKNVCSISSTAWINKRFPVKGKYKSSISSLHGVEMFSVGFPKPALELINKLTAEKTNGKIPSIVENLSPENCLVLVNSIYMNDGWADPFDKKQNVKMKFHRDPSSSSEVPFMFRRMEGGYFENDRIQRAEISYRSGLTMSIVVPRLGVTLAQALADPAWASPLKYESGWEGELYLPKWEGSTKVDCKALFNTLGVSSVFSPGNLEDVCPNAVVSSATQKTWIKVDERGTEAAAATEIEMAASAKEPVIKKFKIVADRPFMYSVRTSSGVLLFAGIVRLPQS